MTKQNIPDALDDETLDPPEVLALVLGYSIKTLANKRLTGDGPPFVKLGGSRRGAVGYRRSDWRAWLAKRTRINTAGGTPEGDACIHGAGV